MSKYIQLIEGCLKNNPKYQKQLFDTLGPLLMSICYRYTKNKSDAEDVLQESFINIFKSLNKFNHKGSFEGWTRRITVNCALRFIEKRNNKRTISDDNIHIVFEPTIIDSIQVDELLELITQLPEGYQTVFNLSIIDGYKHKEIAEMLNIKESSSRSQLLKARGYLQKLILERDKYVAIRV